MKLLLLCIDGLRADLALPHHVAADEAFRRPDHDGDPKFGATGADHTVAPDEAPERLAPTLDRLIRGSGPSEGAIVPVWMTPPTDSGPGWSSLLTGSTHDQCNVWWNEFVGHDLARRPDILTRLWAANPAARTMVAATWWAFVDAPGPILQRRVDQQRTGQHQTFQPRLADGLEAADAEVTQWANWHVLHDGPDAAVVYWEGIDGAGHAHGADSKEYRDAVSTIDEYVRHMVKAVYERHEELGEDWLVAVTTDHGHKPEGGHGEDEVEVRRSFLILHHVGGPLPDVELPTTLRSEEVTPLLLRLVGADEGRWDSHDVGARTVFEPKGPTRDLDYEW
ncbi:alkaline phosphatase family protein [uncultured Tessaracoccus sp.]|uniref:alkaline phosphatase family protein n=1 Tax=uncultured Tessaracoccus sp. TaxID=905023 RepID=UPI0025D6DB8B|nr:alkaline phosphatase family protein [uncultured Tessaracoccus sp.]